MARLNLEILVLHELKDRKRLRREPDDEKQCKKKFVADAEILSIEKKACPKMVKN